MHMMLKDKDEWSSPQQAMMLTKNINLMTSMDGLNLITVSDEVNNIT